MSDNELLELAAKALGWTLVDTVLTERLAKKEDGRCTVWTPLRDDGDALRLAVKLDLLRLPEVSVFAQSADDALDATRRAIVHAAAEIGRNI